VKVKILRKDTVRFNESYLKFDPIDMLQIEDIKLANLLIEFGIAEKISDDNENPEDTTIIYPSDEAPAEETKKEAVVVEKIKEQSKPKKEGKRSIFNSEN